MTNDEKVKEIVSCHKFGTFISPFVNGTMYDAALEMAEWKDQQFKEYLENTIKAYKCLGEEFFVAEIKVLEEIINELFNN